MLKMNSAESGVRNRVSLRFQLNLKVCKEMPRSNIIST